MGLVSPSVPLINQFILCRANVSEESVTSLCEACEINVSPNDLTKLIKAFRFCNESDELLIHLFRKIKCEHIDYDVQLAVITLDSIYHTQLKDAYYIARRMNEEFDSIAELIRYKNLVPAVEKISNIFNADNDENYIYSFASKFCSFMDSSSYPIFDTYSSNLIYLFLQEQPGLEKQPTKYKYKTYLGMPYYFKRAYDEFLDLYNLSDNYNYKQVDMFLWMYGKMLDITNTRNFNHIDFIPLKKRYKYPHYPF